MDFSPLNRFLDSIPELGIPGADCTVAKGYDILYRHSVGYADREQKLPVCGNETMFMYSCTKPITCTAALQLYEKGLFLLTDPLYAYIPEFRDVQVRTMCPNGDVEVRPAKNPITIGDLFGMTAGMGYDLQMEATEQVKRETNGRAPTLDIVRAMAKQPLNYEPGTHWAYSLAHDVLGGLIEVISGQSLGSYLKESIFDPLEMTHTGFRLTEESKKNMMAQYWREADTGEVRRIPLENAYVFGSEYESGGAGLISSLDDYIKFAMAMTNAGVGANGEKILSSATIDLMRSDRLTPDMKKDFNWVRFKGYGYGLGVRTMVDRAAGGASSSTGEFGWAGAGGCYVLMDPATGISVFYAQHMRKNLEEYVHPRLRNIVYSCMT